MLIKNPITELLYDYDYKGLENIFDYWLKHRTELLSFIETHKRSVKNYDKALEAFELKVRWSSFYGMLYRFYLKTYLEKFREKIEFKEIRIQYGRHYMFHEDFIGLISEYVPSTALFDLRGISLLRYVFKDTVIENVDFSYGSLNSCQFESVTFKNCRFEHTEFIASQFKNCSFDADCILRRNDFTNAYIDGEFNCGVKSPRIKPADWKSKLQRKLGRENNYLNYTKIESSTFLERAY